MENLGYITRMCPQPLDIKTLLDACKPFVETTQALFGFQVSWPENTTTITLDGDLFLWLFYNLLYRSIHRLHDKASVSITVTIHNPYTIFQVTDDGYAVKETPSSSPLFLSQKRLVHQAQILGWMIGFHQLRAHYMTTLHVFNNEPSNVIPIFKT